MRTRHGGVCLLDLDTEAFSLLVDPAVDEFQDLGTVAPTGTACPDAPWPRLYWRAGTWLGVGTGGSGMWVGEATW